MIARIYLSDELKRTGIPHIVLSLSQHCSGLPRLLSEHLFVFSANVYEAPLGTSEKTGWEV